MRSELSSITPPCRARSGMRGMVLITTLALLCFLVMLATMLTVTTLTNVSASRFDHEKEVALQIAKSGLDYAVWRIENYPPWVGSGDAGSGSSSVTIDRNGLKVTEKDGLVHGDVYDKSGVLVGYFKLVFTTDTTTPAMSHISINNIRSFSKRTTSTGKVISPGMVYLAVEGRTYAGSAKAITVKKTVEATFINNIGKETGNGVAYAGGKMGINILNKEGNWYVDSSDDSFQPSLKSLGNILAVNDKAPNPQFYKGSGAAYVGEHKDFKLRFSGDSVDKPTHRVSASDFPRLDWDTLVESHRDLLTRASSKIEAPAGTYVWRYNEKSGKYSMTYYPGDYDEDTDFSDIAPGGNVFSSATTGVDSPHLVIDKPLTVTPATSPETGCFKVIGVDLPRRPSVFMQCPDNAEPQDVPSIYNGDLAGTESRTIYIGGEISGSGSIISQGDLRFGGKSVLSATGDSSGLLFYARGDVVIDPLGGRRSGNNGDNDNGGNNDGGTGSGANNANNNGR